ncbi:MAG: YegS/Rv2252/BmrU family lipid kinase [Actinobacteria bacterium]|nr:YegS/Rv2252/BmrU family lipid kinase [Actinomycetota bacterium]
MTLALILNPTSGGGKGLSRGLAAAEILTPSITHRSTSYEDTLAAVDRAAAAGCREIAACGGDGMMHAVIQGCVKHNLTLLPIPAGTGNDFARGLGIEVGDPLTQLHNTRVEERIDLGQLADRYFGAILSSGFDAVVNERANKVRWPKGPMRYNVAMLQELPKFFPIPFTLHLDGLELKREAMLVAVANGPSYGGGMLVCPDASMKDGLFDVMILNAVSKPEFLKVFPRVYKGSHVNHPAVEIHRAAHVRIEASAIGYADGERMGSLPIEARVAPAALKILRAG